MAPSYLNRAPSRYVSTTIDPYSKHIPVKRIAPCPSSMDIVAQAKRSRMVHPNSAISIKRPSLSIRNVNVQNENHARAISWGQANCFQSYGNVGTPVTPCADSSTVKGLRYDPVNSSNVSRASRAATVSDMRKSRCCPVLTSSNAFSTPPYCLNNEIEGKDNKKASRRRPLCQRLKRRSAEGKKLKNTGCLSVIKNAAHGTIRTAEACIEKNIPQPEINALSVYHSFLKQREDALKVEKVSRIATSAVMSHVSSTSNRTANNTSVRYSSNFTPQLTSTPQKSKCTEAGIFAKPLTPTQPKQQSRGNPLTEVLKALEEERKAGSSHISLPLRELTEMVKDLQKHQSDESSPDGTSCASSTGTSATNNNVEDFSVKIKPQIARSRLPGMYPIGAPRAASSFIGNFDDDESSVTNVIVSRKRHLAGEVSETVFSTALAGGATDVWRPW